MEKFRILSIDGGGLRGVVPLTILKKIEEIEGKRIHEIFDLVVGTSTGGLIACAMMLKDEAGNPKYTLDDIMNVYVNRGREIFPERGFFGRLLGGGVDLMKPKFGTKGIEKVFSDILANHKLTDVLKNVMVCSYDLTNNSTLFFKSRLARKNANQDARLYDICRATSAGPSYLPSYKFYYQSENEDPNRNCIDGGVFVNNPSMAALAEFSNSFEYYLPTTTEKDIVYEQVFVLSLGTGSYTDKINSADSQNKGELFWAKHISDVMMRGVNRATDYAMSEMMEKDNYLRLSISIDTEEHADMSNSSSETTAYLIRAVESQVTNNPDTSKMDKLRALLKKMR